MKDLIERQAAISAITSYSGVVDKSVAKRILTQLPSAQPEETCDTCIHSLFRDSRCEECRVGRMSYPSYYKRRTDGTEQP